MQESLAPKRAWLAVDSPFNRIGQPGAGLAFVARPRSGPGSKSSACAGAGSRPPWRRGGAAASRWRSIALGTSIGEQLGARLRRAGGRRQAWSSAPSGQPAIGAGNDLAALGPRRPDQSARARGGCAPLRRCRSTTLVPPATNRLSAPPPRLAGAGRRRHRRAARIVLPSWRRLQGLTRGHSNAWRSRAKRTAGSSRRSMTSRTAAAMPW